MTKLPKHPFWNFSLRIYAQPAAKEALLELQNQYGLNVNILLYCCWIALVQQGQLSQPEIKHLSISTHLWHENIVTNLRLLRDKLTNATSALRALREEVLNVELMAEQVEQLLLAGSVLPKTPRNRRNLGQKAGNACHNIANYCKVAYINLDHASSTLIAQFLNIVFPEINSIESLNLCKSVFFSRATVKKPSQSQLQLKLRP